MNKLNQSKKIALTGIISALAVAVMLIAFFPYLTYAVPAAAGILTVVLVVEIDVKWAFLSYGVTALISALFCEKEASIVYIAFFGFYPIVKYLIEKLQKRKLETVLKFVLFNLCLVLVVILTTAFLGIDVAEFMGTKDGFKFGALNLGYLAKYMGAVLVVLSNVMFFVYDYALDRVISLYYHKYHNKIRKLINR